MAFVPHACDYDFYTYVPPRPLSNIDADLKAVEKDIADLLAEVAA